MASKSKAKTTKTSFPIGLRVRHVIDKRSALVVGRGEANGIKSLLYPVTIEGSTRTELWPEHLIRARPRSEQFPAHGGSFQAPPGYPLYIHVKRLPETR